MSDVKLFKLHTSGRAVELPGEAVSVERSLQTMIERDSETFLGVTFLASEYSTGKTHGGRIDTLAIDEDDCPVIIEYKRSTNENVINQGLFYLDWLLDHKAEFQLLVQQKLGGKRAAEIDWTAPRLLCIAGDFTRYDKHAVQQINRNIDLLRYQKFGNDLLALQLVHRTSNVVLSGDDKLQGGPARPSRRGGDKPSMKPSKMRSKASKTCSLKHARSSWRSATMFRKNSSNCTWPIAASRTSRRSSCRSAPWSSTSSSTLTV
jgi:hypothetical protein